MSTRNLEKHKPRRSAHSAVSSIEEWELVAELGRGRWLPPYRARPRRLPPTGPADYVVKMPIEASDSELATRMLRREAAISQQVAHPHLQTVLSVHLDSAPNYLVLPYLAGGTWTEFSTSPRWRLLPRRLWIFRQLAEGLRALHGAGWIHGDIAPGNVHVATSGHATLIDLGMSYRRETDCDYQASFRGTLQYAAPESLVSSRPIGPCSDIYSLGVLLFQTLSGRLPFRPSDQAHLVRAHRCATPPSLRRLVPQLPSGLVCLVEQMLAKEPLRRPLAEELAKRLIDLEVATFSETLCPGAAVQLVSPCTRKVA
ncbi:MAG: hypothetical protein CMJ59_25790 [Planctomycetaceae bacterium]|nr:hypothetical protein [Planctomycetaceae bacterium]